jgi:hypothetical protein
VLVGKGGALPSWVIQLDGIKGRVGFRRLSDDVNTTMQKRPIITDTGNRKLSMFFILILALAALLVGV